MDMPEDEIDRALHRGGDEDGDDDDGGDDVFEIWPANERSVAAFLHVRRQWRVGPWSGYIGLDYPGVESLLRMRGIAVDAALMDDLGVMEEAAVDVLNAQK